MAYLPRFQKQLVDAIPTKGEDCVVRSALMGIDYATRGEVRPTVKEFRTRAGNLKTGLNTGQLQKGVQSYNLPTETKGYGPLRCIRVSDGDWNDVVKALRADQWACCWVNYGWVNDHYPHLSGDPAYRGTHCIGALGLRLHTKPNGTRIQQVRVYDPTYDGRRTGIPDGPQWWQLPILREACARAEGVGQFRGGIIPISQPIGWI